MRAAGLPLAPTFIPFTPWTTRESYREFLRALVELGLADQVAPIQLAIRLLIPEGSLLLELPEVRGDDRAVRSARPVLSLAESPIRELDRAVRVRFRRPSSARSGGAQPAAEIFRKIWDLAEAGEFPRCADGRRGRRSRI